MLNYKSNDNSTENTTLREWWGIVRAELSRVFEILNEAVGKFTADGGIIFGKESKAALSPNAVAMGPNCTAGGKGFQIINQGSYTEGESYTFPYMQHDGAGYATLYVSNLSPFKVGMKCSITIDGITCTDAIIEEVVSESISLTLSGIPWDFPSGSGTLILGAGEIKTTYALDSVDGLKVGMQYSLVNPSGESKYNAGTITKIDGDNIVIDSDSNDNVEGLYIAIIGHPELGTDDIGTNAFATGNSTIASSAEQSARGRFNVEDNVNKYADIVGNGTSDEDRSNAYTLDWNGNGWFKGTVTVGVNKDKLATEAFVSEQLPFIGNSVTGGTYKVKRHVGETIPNGTSVILKYVHSPSGNCYNTDGSAQVTTVDSDVNYNGKIIVVGEDVVSSGWTGLTIGSIGDWDCTGSDVGYYDENWYAVFEVTTKGTITTLEERIAALEAVIANIQNAEEASF